LKQLLERLKVRLPMLTGGSRDGPTRHQAMRDSIGWSYDLLTPDEQAVFRRASVFVGGFCLEAIEEVAADAVGRAEVLGHVRSLAGKSLIRPVPIADVPRYLMLETIREFALEQHEVADDVEAARAAHAAWCAQFAGRFASEVTGPELAKWIPWAEAELDNVRSALGYAEERGDAATAVRLSGAIGWLWLYPGRLQEGRSVLERVLAMPGAESNPHAFAEALLCAGAIECWLEHYSAGRGHYERAREVCQVSGDERQAMLALRGIGTTLLYLGDLDEATALLIEARQRAIAAGLAWDEAYATYLVGIARFAQEDFAAAQACEEEVLAAFRSMGDQEYVANALEALGWIALRRGDAQAARCAFLGLLELGGETDDQWCRARALSGLGAAISEIDPHRATVLLAAAAHEFESVGTGQRIPVQATYADILEQAQARLGEVAFADEWAKGSALSVDDAAAEARTIAGAPQSLDTEFGLTRRECEVLRLVAEGLTDKEIADRLFISRRTVSKHVESILAKLGVESRRAAALMAAPSD
jgi:non-specific serine/threonine protein kinase